MKKEQYYIIHNGSIDKHLVASNSELFNFWKTVSEDKNKKITFEVITKKKYMNLKLEELIHKDNNSNHILANAYRSARKFIHDLQHSVVEGHDTTHVQAKRGYVAAAMTLFSNTINNEFTNELDLKPHFHFLEGDKSKDVITLDYDTMTLHITVDTQTFSTPLGEDETKWINNLAQTIYNIVNMIHQEVDTLLQIGVNPELDEALASILNGQVEYQLKPIKYTEQKETK